MKGLMLILKIVGEEGRRNEVEGQVRDFKKWNAHKKNLAQTPDATAIK